MATHRDVPLPSGVLVPTATRQRNTALGPRYPWGPTLQAVLGVCVAEACVAACPDLLMTQTWPGPGPGP
jgi:hypothetical protein